MMMTLVDYADSSGTSVLTSRTKAASPRPPDHWPLRRLSGIRANAVSPGLHPDAVAPRGELRRARSKPPV